MSIEPLFFYGFEQLNSKYFWSLPCLSGDTHKCVNFLLSQKNTWLIHVSTGMIGYNVEFQYLYMIRLVGIKHHKHVFSVKVAGSH